MRKFFKRLSLLLVITIAVAYGGECSTAAARGLDGNINVFSHTYADNLYPIMGSTSTTIGQMINYYSAKASYPSFYIQSDAPTIYDFCKIYIEECAAEGVRAEVAFAQAMKETGFLRYGGDVSISQYNFAGLGATGGGNPGNSFPSVRIGVRAQVQHLKAYATSAALNNECVDPRYKYVNKGSAPYVEWLGKYENPSGIGWATAVNYGYSIVEHYINPMRSSSTYSTWYNGVDYSAVYDPEYYMSTNPDVASVAGYSSDSLILHFINYGMREGRQAIPTFNVTSYRYQYVDLRNAFGTDLVQYYYHYMQHGKAEGRDGTGCSILVNPLTVYDGVDYSAVYDYNYYVQNNPDVAKAYPNDDIAVLKHFIMYGMREGRQAKSTFSVASYRCQYADLRRAYETNLPQYYLHYIVYGQKEGRSGTGCTSLQNGTTVYDGVDYSAVYDYNYYVAKYADIAAAFPNDDSAVLKHFVTYGMREGRQAIGAFNVSSYYYQYADLRRAFGTDLPQYYLHYIRYGKAEGRAGTGCTSLVNPTTIYDGVDYSAVYDYNYYVTRYADIAQAYLNDEDAVLKHFIDYGMAEGRQANVAFNVLSYRALYVDLQNAFGYDLKSYYLHYINYGQKEGRIAN